MAKRKRSSSRSRRRRVGSTASTTTETSNDPREVVAPTPEAKTDSAPIKPVDRRRRAYLAGSVCLGREIQVLQEGKEAEAAKPASCMATLGAITIDLVVAWAFFGVPLFGAYMCLEAIAHRSPWSDYLKDMPHLVLVQLLV